MGWYPRARYRGPVARQEANTVEGHVERGTVVEVVAGRKVPRGIVGEIFWVGASQFGLRVGLKDEAGTVHWTAAGNVRPICADCA